MCVRKFEILCKIWKILQNCGRVVKMSGVETRWYFVYVMCVQNGGREVVFEILPRDHGSQTALEGE